MSSQNRLTIDEILHILEDGDRDYQNATLYTLLPANHMMSDEDSGGESDENDINHLSGNQLLAEGQLRATVITRNGLEEATLGYSNWTENANVDGTVVSEVLSSPSDFDPRPSESYSSDNQGKTHPHTIEPLPSTSSKADALPRLEKRDFTMSPCRPKRKQVNTQTNSKKFKTLNKINEHVVTKLNKTQSYNKNKGTKQKTSDKVINSIVNKTKNKKWNWNKQDIPCKPEREWTRPDFLLYDRTPVDLFELFFDDDIINTMVEESKRYAMQKGNHNFTLIKDDIRLLISILLLSGYCPFSRNHLYWDSGVDTIHPGVANAISRNRFEEILRYFHVSDNTNLSAIDKFAKVRPLWAHLNKKFIEYYPKDPYLSVDESMVRYFGRHGTKQHIHNKPIRFGFKVWSMCTRLGYLVQAEPYQGASTGNTNPLLGCGGSVVANLVCKLPRDALYSLFIDNYFTSLKLIEELAKDGHDVTGTIRADRLDHAPLSYPTELRKMPRGSYDQVTEEDTGKTLVRYKDINVVTVASNRAGVNPLGTCNRWSNEVKNKIQVKQPACVTLYNQYMGGVDRLDQNVAAYMPNIKMKKWYWQLILFPLQSSANNAYQLYKLTPAGKEKGSLDWLGFIRQIVQVYLGKYSSRPAIGRPVKPVKRRVPNEVRLDNVGHLIVSNATLIRCGQCHKNTTKKCKKCDVGCHAKCFEQFHS